MFTLRVTYLLGRVYSSAFEEGDLKQNPEWPPHPSRLFSALVAAWGDGGAEPELQPALAWLEQQPAPILHFGEATARKVVSVYVPVNDESSLPEERSRKARTFPSATLSHPDVYFVWEQSPPEAIAQALDRILLRTSSLGHSSSLVSVEITQGPIPDTLTRWHPDAPVGTRLRIAYPGRLHELEERYRRFSQQSIKRHRPAAGRTTLYAPPVAAERPAVQGVFDRMVILRRRNGPKASLVSTLSLTAALRGALLSRAPQPVPEYLSGHAADSTPAHTVPSQHPHVAFAPLAFTTDLHATGEILGLAVLLPRTLTPEQRTLCWDTLAEVQHLDTVWGTWDVELTDAEERRTTLQLPTWTTLFGNPCLVWSTVTPFVFDRFPDKPYGPEAEGIVRQAFAYMDLPEPSDVDLHASPWHRGVPHAKAFPATPTRPGRPQRYACHVRARFAEPVRGPVIAGAGRYYGYGLFRPLPQNGGER